MHNNNKAIAITTPDGSSPGTERIQDFRPSTLYFDALQLNRSCLFRPKNECEKNNNHSRDELIRTYISR